MIALCQWQQQQSIREDGKRGHEMLGRQDNMYKTVCSEDSTVQRPRGLWLFEKASMASMQAEIQKLGQAELDDMVQECLPAMVQDVVGKHDPSRMRTLPGWRRWDRLNISLH